MSNFACSNTFKYPNKASVEKISAIYYPFEPSHCPRIWTLESNTCLQHCCCCCKGSGYDLKKWQGTMTPPPSSSTTLWLVTYRHLRVPYQQLVVKQHFDKIMDVLLKEQNSDTLRLWLEGSIPKSIVPTENIGDTALHRIAVVQPPGRCFCVLMLFWSPLQWSL